MTVWLKVYMAFRSVQISSGKGGLIRWATNHAKPQFIFTAVSVVCFALLFTFLCLNVSVLARVVANQKTVTSNEWF